MKKLILSIGIIIIFAFFYNKVNNGAPREIEITKFKEGELFSYNNCDIVAQQKEIFDGNNKSILPIEYKVINNNDEDVDLKEILLPVRFSNGLSQDIAQNFYFKNEIPEGFDVERYDKEYTEEDFILQPKEEKIFELYYPVNREYFKEYPSCIKFLNNLYRDKYVDKLNNGIFYYEILELGDIR